MWFSFLSIVDNITHHDASTTINPSQTLDDITHHDASMYQDKYISHYTCI